MSRYAVKIIVRNLDNEGGDDTDDAIVSAEVIADSATLAARLKGEVREYTIVSPQLTDEQVEKEELVTRSQDFEDHVLDGKPRERDMSQLHSVRSELH